MNEKITFRLFIVLIVVAFFSGGAAGFYFGRGNPGRLVEFESTNRELAATVGSLTAERDRERAIVKRIRDEQTEERELIATAIGACRAANNSVQGITAKVEILNGLIRDLERRVIDDGNLSGSE